MENNIKMTSPNVFEKTFVLFMNICRYSTAPIAATMVPCSVGSAYVTRAATVKCVNAVGIALGEMIMLPA